MKSEMIEKIIAVQLVCIIPLLLKLLKTSENNIRDFFVWRIRFRKTLGPFIYIEMTSDREFLLENVQIS